MILSGYLLQPKQSELSIDAHPVNRRQLLMHDDDDWTLKDQLSEPLIPTFEMAINSLPQSPTNGLSHFDNLVKNWRIRNSEDFDIYLDVVNDKWKEHWKDYVDGNDNMADEVIIFLEDEQKNGIGDLRVFIEF